MPLEYRQTLVNSLNCLIQTRHDLFGFAVNVAMAKELLEIDSVLEEGDTFKFELDHLDNSNDINLQKLVDLIRHIEQAVDDISNLNSIEDSELDER